MKTLNCITITFATFLFATANLAFAQVESYEGEKYAGYALASEIVDKEVRNMQDEDIGDINDLLIDARNGRIRFAVLGVGGFLGIGETLVTVPWGSFSIRKEGETVRYTLDATKERLQSAPRFDRQKVDEMYAREQAEPVYVYWRAIWMEDLGFPAPAATPAVSPGPAMSPTPGMTPEAGTTPAGGTTPGAEMTPGAGTTPLGQP